MPTRSADPYIRGRATLCFCQCGVAHRGRDVMSGCAGISEQPAQGLAEAVRLAVERQSGGLYGVSHESAEAIHGEGLAESVLAAACIRPLMSPGAKRRPTSVDMTRSMLRSCRARRAPLPKPQHRPESSRRQHKPSGIEVREGVHFTEF